MLRSGIISGSLQTSMKGMVIMGEELQEFLEEQNTRWINCMNTDRRKLMEMYHDQALLFFEFNPVCKGTLAIEDFYAKEFDGSSITSMNTDYLIQLRENNNMAYELGSFATEHGVSYRYLTIWSRKDDTSEWRRELEVLAFNKNSASEEVEITKVRRQWVDLANRHVSLALVAGTYSEDFTYYNRGEVYQGYEALAEAYSYMNFKAFSIDLTPNIHVPVQDDLAFEIGTWHNEGIGSYIIIWKKDKQHGWKIYLDANW